MALTLHLRHLFKKGRQKNFEPALFLPPLYFSPALSHQVPSSLTRRDSTQPGNVSKTPFFVAALEICCGPFGGKLNLPFKVCKRVDALEDSIAGENADLLHVVLCEAGAVEGVLGDGDHHPRLLRARPLRVRHQLHNGANTLAGSCKYFL